MKAVNWTEATRSAELLVHRCPAVLAEPALLAGLDKQEVTPILPFGDKSKWQSLVDIKHPETDEAERLELSIASHLDRARAIQDQLADRAADSAIRTELVALKTGLLRLSKRFEREFAQASDSQEPRAAKLSDLRALGDQRSFAAYSSGLLGTRGRHARRQRRPLSIFQRFSNSRGST